MKGFPKLASLNLHINSNSQVAPSEYFIEGLLSQNQYPALVYLVLQKSDPSSVPRNVQDDRIGLRIKDDLLMMLIVSPTS
jgi:hypothetical protein